jgi:hypothetical protein
MLRRQLTSSSSSVVASIISAPAVALLCGAARYFDSGAQTTDEMGHQAKVRAITPIVGAPKPAMREGDWVCAFPLHTPMRQVLRKVLGDEGWSPAEIDREVDNFEAGRGARALMRDRRETWDTVEAFQRTPWYRRYRPNESGSLPMVSYEAMKLLERSIVPPSSRGDPYAHLRKRHYEDTFHTEKFSEGYIKNMSRDALAAYTKGTPQYGSRTRKQFLEFEALYKKRQDGAVEQRGESYNAYAAMQRSLNKTAAPEGK